MKYILPSLLLLLLSFSSSGQKVAVSADKMNIVYIGVPNPMSIVAENYPCDQLIVSTDNGKIEKNDDWKCFYLYYPKEEGISIISVFNSKKQLINETKYRVKRLPNPIISISGKSAGEIKKNILIKSLGIAAVLQNFDIDARYVVTDYKIELIQNNQITFSKEVDDARFSEEIINAFKSLNNGDRMLISKITVKAPDSRLLKLDIAEFIIID